MNRLLSGISSMLETVLRKSKRYHNAIVRYHNACLHASTLPTTATLMQPEPTMVYARVQPRTNTWAQLWRKSQLWGTTCPNNVLQLSNWTTHTTCNSFTHTSTPVGYLYIYMSTTILLSGYSVNFAQPHSSGKAHQKTLTPTWGDNLYCAMCACPSVRTCCLLLNKARVLNAAAARMLGMHVKKCCARALHTDIMHAPGCGVHRAKVCYYWCMCMHASAWNNW